MTIPEKAIDDAGAALRNAFDRGEGGFDELARLAIEAAFPHLMAAAWNLGLTAGIRCERGQVIDNPYF